MVVVVVVVMMMMVVVMVMVVWRESHRLTDRLTAGLIRFLFGRVPGRSPVPSVDDISPLSFPPLPL